VLAAYAGLAPYVATIASVPVASDEVVQVAIPEINGCAEQPLIELAPDVKLTVPVGVPLPELTLALKVTELDVTLGFNDE
jgi:hypothetical protein